MKIPYLRKTLCQAEQQILQSPAVPCKQQKAGGVHKVQHIPDLSHGLAIDLGDLVLSSLQ